MRNLAEFEVDISVHKLTDYLLIKRAFEDKSKFLAIGGYTLENWQKLKTDLIHLAVNNIPIIESENDFGKFIKINGELIGINTKLYVSTIWLNETNCKKFRFITLFPYKNKKDEHPTL